MLWIKCIARERYYVDKYLLCKNNAFFPSLSCSHVIKMVWLHHSDFYETLRQKLRLELHKEARCYFETKQLLYRHLPPILQTIQLRQTKHAAYLLWSKDKLIGDVPLGTQQCWSTSKNLNFSALCGHWKPSRELKSNGH